MCFALKAFILKLSQILPILTSRDMYTPYVGFAGILSTSKIAATEVNLASEHAQKLISICVEVSPEVIMDTHLESQNIIPAFLWDEL